MPEASASNSITGACCFCEALEWAFAVKQGCGQIGLRRFDLSGGRH
jgi:hypothetical protein